ncbi:50S ribosomal protein L21, chloroplastic isoform X2 [Nymphaea colorata]|uniref:50S ribosomal protein L21, chloroplastic isoform X2 n=1 Tax=Nymphaea colorata TaxID=210225 RepID=UPI00129DCE6F|nr:50S ribosomal protein L21, chloroplastic isoform X2 [Nymphaea colorata]
MASILSISTAPPSARIPSTATSLPSPALTTRLHLPSSSSSSRLSSTVSRFLFASVPNRRVLPPVFVTAAELAEPEETTDSEAVGNAELEANQLAAPLQIPKGEEVFAVGSRQYIVFPGRFLYVQRLKGANVNDKIILNNVLLVSTKSNTYIGKPVVPNAAVHAVVEEHGLNRKVIVFKYKKKKNYRRNIGHRQPNTRIRITGISGYQDAPAVEVVTAQ